MADVIQVEIVTPERLAYKGEATEVEAPGWLGEIGVLAGHAQLLTLSRPGVVTVHQVEGGEMRMLVGGGFAEVGPFGVTMLVDLAEDVGGIDKQAAQASLSAAEQVIATADPLSDDYAVARRQAELAQARLDA